MLAASQGLRFSPLQLLGLQRNALSYRVPSRNTYNILQPAIRASSLHWLLSSNLGTLMPKTSMGKHWRTGYLANLWLRSAIRVLLLQSSQPLQSGSYDVGGQLYTFFSQAADWARFLQPGQTFSVEGRVAGRTDVNQQFLRLRARDAICDAVRSQRGSKPQPPAPNTVADLPLFVRLDQDHISLYRDMSGRSLHNRGYRSAMHRAALNEAAAAGILLLAGWPELAQTGNFSLADPMCGSGTFLIEAAMMATCTAPGLARRHWPFQSWPEHDASEWDSCVSQARQRRIAWRGRLMGNDVHPGALALAQRGVEAAGVGHLVLLQEGACQHWKPREQPTIVVCNPPWGNRLLGFGSQNMGTHGLPASSQGPRWRAAPGRGYPRQDQQRVQDAVQPELEDSWRHLGAFLKTCYASPNSMIQHIMSMHERFVTNRTGHPPKGQCANADVFLLSGNADVTQHLRMKATKRMVLGIGGTDCRLLHYKVLPPKPAAVYAP